MWEYDLASNTWSVTDQTDVIGTRHNCSFAYDPVNDLVHFSACAPSKHPDGTDDLGEYVTWSPATKTFNVRSTAIQPCSVDPLMVYVPPQQAIYCVGGWSGQANNRVLRVSVNPLGLWTELAADGPDFLFATEVRESNLRGGWDPETNRLWFIDGLADLWLFDTVTAAWTRTVTTGEKPPLPTAYMLDVAARRIVGWAGIDPNTSSSVLQTYLLDLSMNVWSLGPNGSHGPKSTGGYYTFGVAYDPAAQDPILFVSSGLMDVWAFRSASIPPSQRTLRMAVSPVGSGETTPPVGANGYEDGTVIALSAQANSGYQFQNWSGDADCTDTSVTMNVDKSCTANFQAVAPATFTLTVSTSGEGTTNPGSGSHIHGNGAVVTLTASPASGYQFAGWGGDSDCQDGSLTMIANRSCVANFVPQTGGSIPIRTFVAYPKPLCPPMCDESMWTNPGGNKHIRYTYDSTRKLTCTGFGDYGPSANSGLAQNNAFCYDSQTEHFFRWQDWCRPLRQIMPGMPDEVPWGYDRNRHAFWLFPGVTQGGETQCRASNLVDDLEDGAIMNPAPAGHGRGLWKFDIALDRWELIPGSGSLGTNSLSGRFDAIRDEMIYVENGGCGVQVSQLDVVTLEKRTTPLCVSADPFPGTGVYGPGTFLDLAGAFNTAQGWAWDEAGRTAYFLLPQFVKNNSGDALQQRVFFYKWHADTQAVTPLADPPNHLLPFEYPPDAFVETANIRVDDTTNAFIRTDGQNWDPWFLPGRTVVTSGFANPGNNSTSQTPPQNFYNIVSVSGGIMVVDASLTTEAASASVKTLYGRVLLNNNALHYVWDSANRRVLYPYTREHCGVVEGMYVYDPATNTWESFPVTISDPQGNPISIPNGFVQGNGSFFDPDQNYMVIGGSIFCPDVGWSAQAASGTHYFKWRYGP